MFRDRVVEVLEEVRFYKATEFHQRVRNGKARVPRSSGSSASLPTQGAPISFGRPFPWSSFRCRNNPLELLRLEPGTTVWLREMAQASGTSVLVRERLFEPSFLCGFLRGFLDLHELGLQFL